METNERMNRREERDSSPRFALGMMTTGALLLAAFTYSSKSEIQKELEKVKPTQITYTTIQEKEPELPKPEVIKTQTPPSSNPSLPILDNPQVVGSEITSVVNTNNPITTVVVPGGGDFEIGGGELEVIDDEIVEYPTKDAEYEGGFGAMMKFIQTNITFPDDAFNEPKKVVVFVRFVVEKDGSVSNVSVMGETPSEYNQAAIKVVRKLKNWTPAETAKGKVRSYVSLPIRFETL